MVETDVGDHGDAAVPCVHRVESTAESDLHHGAIDAGRVKAVEDHAGEQLELGHRSHARLDPAGAARLDTAPGDYVAVRVADDGSGMPAEVLEKAFEPFFTTKEVGKGSGLGLAQVYGFAKQSGGFVQLASEPGNGTTVQLFLPRCVENAAAADKAASALPRPDALRSETILVVDDDVELRDLLRDLALFVFSEARETHLQHPQPRDQ